MLKDTYKGWHIYFERQPFMGRDFDWNYVHEDYDGPPDDRFGFAKSMEDAKVKIDQIANREGE